MNNSPNFVCQSWRDAPMPLCLPAIGREVCDVGGQTAPGGILHAIASGHKRGNSSVRYHTYKDRTTITFFDNWLGPRRRTVQNLNGCRSHSFSIVEAKHSSRPMSPMHHHHQSRHRWASSPPAHGRSWLDLRQPGRQTVPGRSSPQPSRTRDSPRRPYVLYRTDRDPPRD